jgi:Holliday junction resolvasome RuvABC endonuclease subunit
MTVMGLDVSLTSTGAVVMGDSRRVLAHTLFKTKPDKEDYELQRRIDMIVLGIDIMVAEFRPSLIGMENHAFGAAHSNTRVHEVAGVVKYELWNRGIPFLLVAPTELKRWATGNGRATKEMMVEAAAGAGFITKSHDMADAYWAASWADAIKSI